MLNSKYLCFIFLFLSLTLGISCVSASGVDNLSVSDFDDCTLVVDNFHDYIMSDQINESSISYSNNFDDIDANQINKGNIYYNPGSFYELNKKFNKLNPGDTFVFDKDYVFDGNGYKSGIIINLDNLIINGNGHIIDGKSLASIFSVYGNNVKIFNLTVVNANQFKSVTISYNSKFSSTFRVINGAIIWHGNNGVLSDCTFKCNSAINGGAIFWSGSNALINNCVFINNSASGVGGAIYIAGENNTIYNSVFINSTSKLSGEAIFIDRNHKNIKIKNSRFSGLAYREGQKINFDVNNLYFPIMTSFFGTNYDIIKMIYRSLVFNDSIIAIDNNTCYYGTFNNNKFLLIFTKYFGDGLTLTKEYCFNNIISSDDIINAVLNRLYAVKYTFVKHIDVYGTISGPVIGDGPKWYSYDEARTMSAAAAFYPLCIYVFNDDDFDPLLWTNVMTGLKSDYIQTVLDVNFARTLNIFSRQTWQNNGFKTVFINGNNSYINAASSDDDEFTWAEIAEGTTFVISYLTIAHYNRAINNSGICMLNNVHFDSNKMDYWFAKDYGAGIYNAGYCVCNNCSFTNHYAKYGAAIFNLGYLILENCLFSGNYAYNHGNDVLNVGEGIVYLNGKLVVKGYYGPIAYTSDVSSSVVNLIFNTFAVISAVVFLFGTPIASACGSMFAGVVVAVISGLFLVLCLKILDENNKDIGYNISSKYKNYSPKIIDIDKYTRNYKIEIIDAVIL